ERFYFTFPLSELEPVAVRSLSESLDVGPWKRVVVALVVVALVVALVVVTLGARRVLVVRALVIVDPRVVVVALVNICWPRRRGRCLRCHRSSSPGSISLWRLLVALVLSRVVRRRPRRSRASGRILLPCIHTVRKAALRCRFLVPPQWSACVRGQSSLFPFAVSYGLLSTL